MPDNYQNNTEKYVREQLYPYSYTKDINSIRMKVQSLFATSYDKIIKDLNILENMILQGLSPAGDYEKIYNMFLEKQKESPEILKKPTDLIYATNALPIQSEIESYKNITIQDEETLQANLDKMIKETKEKDDLYVEQMCWLFDELYSMVYSTFLIPPNSFIMNVPEKRENFDGHNHKGIYIEDGAFRYMILDKNGNYAIELNKQFIAGVNGFEKKVCKYPSLDEVRTFWVNNKQIFNMTNELDSLGFMNFCWCDENKNKLFSFENFTSEMKTKFLYLNLRWIVINNIRENCEMNFGSRIKMEMFSKLNAKEAVESQKQILKVSEYLEILHQSQIDYLKMKHEEFN